MAVSSSSSSDRLPPTPPSPPPTSSTPSPSQPDPQRLADSLADTVFQRLDRDGDGRLSRAELDRALADLGLSESQRHQQCAIMLPKDGGPMDRGAFRTFCRDRVRRMHDLYQQIDTARTKSLSPEQIRQALRHVGLEADRPKIRRLIAMVDRNGDDRISFDEFYSALLLLPSSSVDDLFRNWDRASLCDLGEASAMIPQPPALSKTSADSTTTSTMTTGDLVGFASSSLIAGAVAGIVSRTVTAPFDRLKLILQANAEPISNQPSIRASFERIYREGGVRGLFRGNFANVVKVCPENAIKMWSFDQLGGFASDDSRSVFEQFAVGAAAGAISQTFIYPLETIKTHFALSRAGQYSSLISCGIRIYQNRGLAGLYRGLSAATAGIIPYAGVDLSLFAFFRRTWEERYPHHNPSAIQLLGFGAVSSTCGQLVAYPLQLIRTRLQSQGMPNRPIRYNGVRDCFHQTVQQDGLHGLYRGLKPNFIKALPSISISYVVYDMVYRYLEEIDDD